MGGHHHHRHEREQPQYPEAGYSYGPGPYAPQPGYPYGPGPYPYAPPPYPVPYEGGYPGHASLEESQRIEAFRHAEEEAQKHRHREHMAEMGAVAAGAFAWYEGHEAKVDPQHAQRHKLEAQIAGTAAVGAAGYALYEHHQSKQEQHVAHSYYDGAAGAGHHHHHHHRHHN